ncbi:MAG: ABC transporter substrate-binding protein [Chthoniobacterales bacterium]
MSTSRLLAILFGALILFSLVAVLWAPDRDPEGKIPLVWVSDNNPARTAQIAAFNDENPDLHLRLDYGNKGPQKVILQSASGVGPDIFDFSSLDIGTYVESGILWDVTEAAEELGFSAEKSGWPASIQTYTYNGRQYGFPCNTGTNILIFNKNVFDHFGIPYPTEVMTWGTFIKLAQKLGDLARGNTQNSRPIYSCAGFDWKLFFASQRGEFFDEKGMLQIANSAALKKAFEMHRDFIFKYKLMPTSVEAQAMSGQGGHGAGYINQFATNRFATIATGYWALIAFNRAHQKQTEYLTAEGISIEDIKEPLDRPVQLNAIPLPHFADQPPSYLVTSRVAGINARSPNREESLRFLKYLSGSTYSKLLNEESDWLPGNPEYAELGIVPGPPALNRENLQAITVKAMQYGYSPRQSPFLLESDLQRVLKAQISRLESDPSLPVDSLLQSADAELQTLMRRNLEHNPELKALFIERFGEATWKALP